MSIDRMSDQMDAEFARNQVAQYEIMIEISQCRVRDLQRENSYLEKKLEVQENELLQIDPLDNSVVLEAALTQNILLSGAVMVMALMIWRLRRDAR